jgi:hypothetical protein
VAIALNRITAAASIFLMAPSFESHGERN